MKQKFIALALSVVMVFTLVGCGKTQSSSQPGSSEALSQGGETVLFTDSTGRQVELPAQITRIAPSGPMAQMVAFALAPDAFVGLSTSWSREAGEFLDEQYYSLPVLGQIYGSGDLNLEELAAADPQLILDIGEPKDSIVEVMDALTQQLGIPTVHITATTETMGEAYRTLGKLLGREEEAEMLAAYCEEIYGGAQALMEEVGLENKANILYCLGDRGNHVIAAGSYHSEVLDLMANNLAVVENPVSKGTGNEVDLEQLLLWNPDIILFAPESIYDSVGTDPAWQKLTAIQTGSYYEVPFGPYNWMGFPPSVNRYLGILWLSELLYPEQSQLDLYTETARYYKLFYHCDLTREQFDTLTARALPQADR